MSSFWRQEICDRIATTEHGYLSRQVWLWHLSISATLLINEGCWPHLRSPLTLHFTGSYGGFCWPVSWSFFSACYVTRDAFPPGVVNTSVRGRPRNRLVLGRLILILTTSMCLADSFWSLQQACVWPTHPDPYNGHVFGRLILILTAGLCLADSS